MADDLAVKVKAVEAAVNGAEPFFIPDGPMRMVYAGRRIGKGNKVLYQMYLLHEGQIQPKYNYLLAKRIAGAFIGEIYEYTGSIDAQGVWRRGASSRSVGYYTDDKAVVAHWHLEDGRVSAMLTERKKATAFRKEVAAIDPNPIKAIQLYYAGLPQSERKGFLMWLGNEIGKA